MEDDTLHCNYENYDSFDLDLPIDVKRSLSISSLPSLACDTLQAEVHQDHSFYDGNLIDQPTDGFGVRPDQLLHSRTQIQLSDLELAPTLTNLEAYPSHVHGHQGNTTGNADVDVYRYSSEIMESPFSSYQYYDESDSKSAWSIASDVNYSQPPAFLEEGEPFDDKPYAMLIYEALKQAPGHRMMLKDIYDWFRYNTTKPQESGSKGWQNSIRHNLSMNKAFENDRDSARGGSRKTNSVWVLTEDAIKNGVQSTTRYRKAGGGKRHNGHRVPAIQRQRSGAKGGRATSRAARQRRQEIPYVTSTPLTCSPATQYSDLSDYRSFDCYDYDLQSAARSWPVTVGDHQQTLPVDLVRCLSDSPPNTMQFDHQPSRLCQSHSEENLRIHSILLRPSLDQSMHESAQIHTR
ncbi:hypothetical protein PV08_03361 [Exophiala spinifera]|uniref:Forkhead box protein O n=1 Tax=Exophiala spinifera TaxID=91928 RepID=A0A0D1YUY3_9EURO|nr:uncharacterized protein PV08_03361 [Exophiala spinifera]KIW19071.1 hypothetical protein PV08_03361 [Exophiala spinifera]